MLRCLGILVVSEQPIRSLRLKGDMVYDYFEGEA